MSAMLQGQESRPPWARELKLVADLLREHVVVSRPPWARELKLLRRLQLKSLQVVAPPVGA